MNDMYNRLMSMSDDEFERLENEETALLERIGATKLHEFDNVGVGKDGELYALESLCIGDELIKNGTVYSKATNNISVGEKIK